MSLINKNGNALFLILIAVALFAALSYAVTQSGRGGGSVNREKARIQAAQVLQYSESMHYAIEKMIILNDCDPTQLNFHHDAHPGFTNSSSPSDGSCDVFDETGGAMTWVSPPSGVDDGTDWHFSGGPVVHHTDGRYSDFTDENAELVMMLFDLGDDVCLDINKGLGIQGIPIDDGSYEATMEKFRGVFDAKQNLTGDPGTSSPSPCAGSPATPNLCGQMTACFQEELVGQRNIFYSVLLERH